MEEIYETDNLKVEKLNIIIDKGVIEFKRVEDNNEEVKEENINE